MNTIWSCSNRLVLSFGNMFVCAILSAAAANVASATDLDNNLLSYLMSSKSSRDGVKKALGGVFASQGSPNSEASLAASRANSVCAIIPGKLQCGAYVNLNTVVNGKLRKDDSRQSFENDYETTKRPMIDRTLPSDYHPQPGDTLITRSVKKDPPDVDSNGNVKVDAGYVYGHVSIVIAYDEKNDGVWVAEANSHGTEEFDIRWRPFGVKSANDFNDSSIRVGPLAVPPLAEYGFERSEFSQPNKDALASVIRVFSSCAVPKPNAAEAVAPAMVDVTKSGKRITGVGDVGRSENRGRDGNAPVANPYKSQEPAKVEPFKWPKPVKW